MKYEEFLKELEDMRITFSIFEENRVELIAPSGLILGEEILREMENHKGSLWETAFRRRMNEEYERRMKEYETVRETLVDGSTRIRIRR